MRILALSEDNLHLRDDTTRLAVENARSDGADDAGMHRMLLTYLLMAGKFVC